MQPNVLDRLIRLPALVEDEHVLVAGAELGGGLEGGSRPHRQRVEG